MRWFVYIVRCGDTTLYTGITTDINRREREHNEDNKRGSKFVRGKRPVKMVYWETYESQSEAQKREAAIKKWNRKYKLKLIEKGTPSYADLPR